MSVTDEQLERMSAAWPRLADGLFDFPADIDVSDESLADLDVAIRACRLLAEAEEWTSEGIRYVVVPIKPELAALRQIVLFAIQEKLEYELSPEVAEVSAREAFDAALGSLVEHVGVWQHVPTLTGDARLTQHQLRELLATLKDDQPDLPAHNIHQARLREAVKQLELRGARVASQAADDGIGVDLVQLIAAARAHADCLTTTNPSHSGSSLPADFPSDEDVEVAAEAWKQARQSPIVNLAAARAALRAVADARRTEEEGVEPCWACEGRGSSIHTYTANCAQPLPPAEED